MSKNKSERLDELLEPVKVAVALGAQNIPVVVGTKAYIASVDMYKHDSYHEQWGEVVGIYDSEIAAEAGLRKWILKRWDNLRSFEYAPWFSEYDQDDIENIADELNEELKEAFLAENSDQDIINAFFHDESPHDYDIESYSIETFEPREQQGYINLCAQPVQGYINLCVQPVQGQIPTCFEPRLIS